MSVKKSAFVSRIVAIISIALLVTSVPLTATRAEESSNTSGSLRVAVMTHIGDRLEIVKRSFANRALADAFLAAVNNDPTVEAASLDIERKALGVSLPVNDPLFNQQWALNTLSATRDWSVSTGTGITVAVVDTGVDATHPDLTGKVLPGTDFVGDSYSNSSNNSGGVDPYGHGTHVAGIITMNANNAKGGVGLAPDVKILPVRVLDASGSGYDSDIARGIIWATDQGAQIINLSLGGAGSSSVLNNAVKYAADRGVAVIAAAGNEGDSGNQPSYPGASPGAIAVAAIAKTLVAPKWSNRGGYVTFAAPGVDIISSTGGGYESWSGTSMATPYIAASYALLESYKPTLTVSQETAALKNGAYRPTGSVTRDDTYGFGIPNLVTALNSVGASISTPSPTFTLSAPASANYNSTQTITVAQSPSGLLLGGYVALSIKPTGYATKTLASKVLFDANGTATFSGAMTTGGQLAAAIYNSGGSLIQNITGPYLNLGVISSVVMPTSVVRPTGNVTISTNSILNGAQIQIQQGNAAGTSWNTILTGTVNNKGSATFLNVPFTSTGQRRVVIAGRADLAINSQTFTVIPK